MISETKPQAPALPPRTDATRQLELNRMKLLATGLLAAAALIFAGALVLERRYPWVGFVRAFAEAAMVGALADWFAVTALFRHPLGLPIPHTRSSRAGKTASAPASGALSRITFFPRKCCSAACARCMCSSARPARSASQP